LIEVPGFSKDDIKIDINENVMSVSGKSKFGKEIKEEFNISNNVEKIKVTVENGMLEIKLVKNKSSTIPIEFE
jgi:HSP20 family molecular chaperone IbpA